MGDDPRTGRRPPACNQRPLSAIVVTFTLGGGPRPSHSHSRYIYISQQSYTHKHNTNNGGTVFVKDCPLNTSRLLQCPTCSSFFLSFSHLQWQSEIGGTILGPDLYQTQPPEAWCSMYIIKDLQSRSPEIHHSDYSDIRHELLTDQTQVGGPFRKRTYT